MLEQHGTSVRSVTHLLLITSYVGDQLTIGSDHQVVEKEVPQPPSVRLGLLTRRQHVDKRKFIVSHHALVTSTNSSTSVLWRGGRRLPVDGRYRVLQPLQP